MGILSEKNINYYSKLLFLLTIAVLLLIYAGHIILPFLFAVFTSLAFLKFAVWLENRGFSRTLASLTVTLLISFAGIIVFLIIIVGGVQLLNDFDISMLHPERVSDNAVINRLQDSIGVDIPIKKTIESLAGYVGKVVSILFSGAQSTLVFFSLLPIYIFFILSYRGHLKVYIERGFGEKAQSKGIKVFHEIATMVRKYILSAGVLIIIIGVLNSIGLLIIGIDHALILGAGTALLIVIPYIGVFIGALIPIAVALVTKDSLYYPLAVLCLYVLIQFLEGNFITPKIIGDSIDLNPLAIILGMIVLGATGGILALVIAIPILGSIKIILQNSERLRHVSLLFQQKIEK